MIVECKCGEVLAEDAEACPACGAPNVAYKPAQPPRLLIAIVGGILVYVGAQQGWPWYWPAAVMGISAVALRRIWSFRKQ
jgi:hypothetical protein